MLSAVSLPIPYIPRSSMRSLEIGCFKKSKRMPTLSRLIISIPIISMINYYWLIGLMNQKVSSQDK